MTRLVGERVLVLGLVSSRFGLAKEAVLALLAANEGTALCLELGHGDCGERRGGVVLGGVVVDLVDGDGGVGDVRLNSLLLDHGLDSLVDVVVLVLACNDGGDLASSLAFNPLGGVDVAGALLGKTSLDLVVVAVLVAAVLNGDDVGVVLGRKNLLVDDRLLGGVVVVLVNLLVDGGDVLLVLLPLDSLVLDGRGDLLVNSGIVVARLGHEVLDGSLGRIHCD